MLKMKKEVLKILIILQENKIKRIYIKMKFLIHRKCRRIREIKVKMKLLWIRKKINKKIMKKI